VILARDVLGDLPGEAPVVAPRRRWVTVTRRIALGTFVLLVALVLLVAIFGHHHRSPAQPLRAGRGNVSFSER
jgi:hypothetical protein